MVGWAWWPTPRGSFDERYFDAVADFHVDDVGRRLGDHEEDVVFADEGRCCHAVGQHTHLTSSPSVRIDPERTQLAASTAEDQLVPGAVDGLCNRQSIVILDESFTELDEVFLGQNRSGGQGGGDSDGEKFEEHRKTPVDVRVY